MTTTNGTLGISLNNTQELDDVFVTGWMPSATDQRHIGYSVDLHRHYPPLCMDSRVPQHSGTG
ncbi:hypothetical protein G647_00333 [Cladophialophora carrionii CBS 160.54]|uniref:Uncharacterized protein n=1 Tax=Cladophialophora carrionii CBS 160.54 TaxID=1279043 RepID=V9DLW7_9EURO|nr:uncharacterized protein G647_00333 [Cladophialophora carrionii CBS 160.54]ETI27884.1 hypothetical protein G647_00333 [Cladophialophora carrionii CBS 160.54]